MGLSTICRWDRWIGSYGYALWGSSHVDGFQHKHLSPPDTWKSLFAHEGLEPNDLGRSIKTADPVTSAPVWTETNPSLFQACQNPAHLEILRLLEENEPHTISVIAIGPLTNIALAASHAPKTLMRAKSIIVMGGTIDEPGNMSPLAEFNTFADSTAAARVYALTSPDPATTMPPFPPRRPLSEEDPGNDQGLLPPYPPKERFGSQRLHVTLFPLDITTTHEMKSDQFHRKVKPLLETGSPLAEWTTAFMVPTFRKMETLHSDGQRDGIAHLALHDPLCVWYALNGFSDPEAWILTKDEDIRVETTGQWTRGACITDKRDRKRSKDPDEEVEGDTDGWLSAKTGNRLQRCIATPGAALLGDLILDTVFGK
ncbi:hypothetical protein MMC25_001796 [Agyrium rufum]|nr:hypothetical protein [Agyrium rufum]